jgi:hypothetical protein
MKSNTNQRRLMKYRRKVDNAFRRGYGYDRLLILHWRYWHKVHGRHALLWK